MSAPVDVDDAFKGFRAAFADLQTIQEKVKANRARRDQADSQSEEWLALDREFRALQKEWDDLHKAFKKETAKFNSVCAATIQSLRRPRERKGIEA
jgi:seryl-tRNA synthetase